ncbi:hypothetical protein HPB49_008964 [Dermacentor silvarum]|uniref:Uncharacterized protein n=1 Tax=Dermacentor silvarum TaxID=543639 RepID=A0ACB8D3Z9_DERSI|nr:hypothetical protein HPB49_008964 [Dermacentor silvarum]
MFQKYKNLLDLILTERPKIQKVYASLLPRCANRRHGNRNEAFIHRFNSEACDFNSHLRCFCRRSRQVFFHDHALEWLPSVRVLAAGGLHPSFEGVALMASHIKQLCFRKSADVASTSRLDHMASCHAGQASSVLPPSAPELLTRDSPPILQQHPQDYSTSIIPTSKPKRRQQSTRKRSGSVPSSHRYSLINGSQAKTATSQN